MSTILLVLSLSLRAPPAVEVRTVSIDWSAIAEQTVARCNLTLLQSMLLQALIEAGFAVVDMPIERTIRLTLRDGRSGILIDAERAGAVAKRAVGLDRRCDSTIGVELQAAAIAAARDVESLTPLPPDVVPAPPPSLGEEPPRDQELERHTTWTRPTHDFVVDPVPTVRDTTERSPSAWFGRVGAGVVASRTGSPFVGVALQLVRAARRWSFGLNLDVAVRSGGSVRVVEPALGPARLAQSCGRLRALCRSVRTSLGPSLHG